MKTEKQYKAKLRWEVAAKLLHIYIYILLSLLYILLFDFEVFKCIFISTIKLVLRIAKTCCLALIIDGASISLRGQFGLRHRAIV
jgi:hypothetical protein